MCCLQSEDDGNDSSTSVEGNGVMVDFAKLSNLVLLLDLLTSKTLTQFDLDKTTQNIRRHYSERH